MANSYNAERATSPGVRMPLRPPGPIACDPKLTGLPTSAWVRDVEDEADDWKDSKGHVELLRGICASCPTITADWCLRAAVAQYERCSMRAGHRMWHAKEASAARKKVRGDIPDVATSDVA